MTIQYNYWPKDKNDPFLEQLVLLLLHDRNHFDPLFYLKDPFSCVSSLCEINFSLNRLSFAEVRGGKLFDPVQNLEETVTWRISMRFHFWSTLISLRNYWSRGFEKTLLNQLEEFEGWSKAFFRTVWSHVIINFEEKLKWIKSETAYICVSWLSSPNSELYQKVYPWVLDCIKVYGSKAIFWSFLNSSDFYLVLCILYKDNIDAHHQMFDSEHQYFAPPDAVPLRALHLLPHFLPYHRLVSCEEHVWVIPFMTHTERFHYFDISCASTG